LAGVNKGRGLEKEKEGWRSLVCHWVGERGGTMTFRERGNNLIGDSVGQRTSSAAVLGREGLSISK